MGFFDKHIQALENTKQATEDTVDGAMPIVAELNRMQLRKGINGDDNVITPDYGGFYGLYKSSLSSYNLDGGTPDLYVSGKFYKAIHAIRKNNNIFIDAPGLDYVPDLKTKYGESILNLTPSSKVTLGKSIAVILEDKLKKIWK